MDDKVRKWKGTTWQLRPTLHMPQLDPEAVQCAVLETDPFVEYKKMFQENRNKFLKEIKDEKDPGQRELIKRSHMTATWDSLFRNTPGDQVYLLATSHGNGTTSPVRSTLISSNSPGGMKWLATKMTYLADAPICWCLPLNLAIGESVEVTIDKGNSLNLEQHYREMIDKG